VRANLPNPVNCQDRPTPLRVWGHLWSAASGLYGGLWRDWGRFQRDGAISGALKSPRLAVAAKVGLSALLLWLALRELHVDSIVGRLRLLDPAVVAFGLFACAAQMVLVAIRWHKIILSLGGLLSFWRSLRIVLVSTFVNQALPATIGGDSVRVFLAWRSGVAIEPAIHGVLLDRLAGVVGLVAAGAFGLPFAVPLLIRSIGWPPIVAVAIICLAAAAMMGAAIYWRRKLPRWPILLWIDRFLGTTRDVAMSPRLLSWALLPSVLVQILSSLFVLVVLRDFGVNVDFAACMLLVPPVILFAMLPVSIAGWGIREGALVVALGLIGVPGNDAIAASLLLGFAQLVTALPGGALLLLYRINLGFLPSPDQLAMSRGLVGNS
jgi:glycosyltransferase 2 family protein